MNPLAALLGVLYFSSLILLFLYGINCYVMLLLHRRHRRAALARNEAIWADTPLARESLPRVTVQLPIYNERYVVERLLASITRLDYPRHRLEIQVLDDSTDDTAAMAGGLVRRYQEGGFDIVHLHRGHRGGYKAGALAAGLRAATGEFVAIFDADFVPPKDFLLRAMPFFRDPRVGLVQCRWGHLNRESSLLTMAQAVGIDGHFAVEQASRAWSGLFMNFNGSAGVWRRAAIEDAGGWTADTLTEDLDLSYRAQLRGWRCVYLPEVECPAEIPVQIQAFKSQQRRWAKGSIQTARKILPAVWRAPIPLFTKVQATMHLTHYAVHPLMLAVALTSIPMLLWGPAALGRPGLFASAGLLALATFGPSSLYLYSQRQLYRDWPRRILYLPALMLAGTGIALSNTRAVLEALAGVGGPFVRTPKYAIEGRGTGWRKRRYGPAADRWAVAEMILGLYTLEAFHLSASGGRYLVTPFFGIYAGAFLFVGLLTLAHARMARSARAPEGAESGPLVGGIRP